MARKFSKAHFFCIDYMYVGLSDKGGEQLIQFIRGRLDRNPCLDVDKGVRSQKSTEEK